MGSSTAETLKEIDEVRASLDRKMRVLDTRLPKPAIWARRAIGFLVGGGALAGFALALLRRRKTKDDGDARIRVEIVPAVPAEVHAQGSAVVLDGRDRKSRRRARR